MPSLSYLEIAQVAVRVLPAAACVPYPPHLLERSLLIRLVSRIGTKELDLSARLFQILQRFFCRRRISIDGEVQIEAVVEWLTEHRPAVQPGEVDVAAGEAVQGMRQASRAVCGYERKRALPTRLAVAWPGRRAAL